MKVKEIKLLLRQWFNKRWVGFKKSSGVWAERKREVIEAGTVRWAGLP